MSNQSSIVEVEVEVKRLSNETLSSLLTSSWVEFEIKNLTGDTGRRTLLANVGKEDPTKLWNEIQKHVIVAYGEERVRATLEGGFVFLVIDTTDYGGKGGPAHPKSSKENKYLQVQFEQKRAIYEALFESKSQWPKWFSV